MNDLDKLEMVEMEIWKNKIRRKFIIAYNPPRNKPDLGCLEDTWDRHCILMGDLNAHSPIWGYTDTCPTGRLFETFMTSNPVQFIDNDTSSPTFLSYGGGTSHPDVVLAHPGLASSINHTLLPSPSGFGHKILSVNLFNQSKMPVKLTSKRMQWNCKKANWKLYEEASDVLLSQALVDENIDKSFTRIKDAVISAAKKAIPKGKVKRYSPFWTEELQVLKEERDLAREQAETTGSGNDRRILKEKTSATHSIIHSKRDSYRSFLNEIDFRKDGVRAHRFISQLNNESSTKKKNPFTTGNRVLTSDADVAKHFCKYYAKMSNFATRKCNGSPETKVLQGCLTEEEMDLMHNDFVLSELDRALQGTPTGKSPGPDEIRAEFLIHLGKKARETILKFFNSIWRNYYPCEWRKAEVVPIPKKGKEPNTPENFRPISLTSVFSKVFERMLLARLQVVIENSQLLSDRQAGFRKNRGAVEQVARLSQEIKDGFQRGQSSLAVFIDFRTAFDRVWRKKLLSKLQPLGIKGNMYKAISSFLAQRYIRVKYNETASSFKQTKHGLPQGSVISPTLFNLMIDDVVTAVQSIPGVQTLLYADDLVVWATSSDINALELTLNQALRRLSEWAAENELVVNTDKTEFQLFTLSTKQRSPLSLAYNMKPLKETNAATYLGIRLDGKLQWTKHVDQLVEKGSKRLGLVKRLTGTKWGAPEGVLTQAYTSYVRPVMEYGSELVTTASTTTQEKLNKIHNHALRLLTGGPRSTPISAMELQTGVDPLDIRREVAAIKLNERVSRLGIDYWNNYRPPRQRLKTQKSFYLKVQELTRGYGLDVLEDRRPFAVQKSSNLLSPRPTGRLDLMQPVRKREMIPAELRAIALETINERYPAADWIHIYTDGSALDARGYGGAGVYSQNFQLSEPVGIVASNFDGEVRAIMLALERLRFASGNKAVIFVDSQAAIQAFISLETSESADILRGWEVMAELSAAGWTLILQWIPSHCGIGGNEVADKLAKEGSMKLQHQPPLEFSTATRLLKGTLKDEVRKRHEGQALGKQWCSLLQASGRLPHDLPRSVAVACFRLTTGHDYLRAHLHKIGVADSPACSLCDSGDVMTGAHLNECEALTLTRRRPEGPDSQNFKLSETYWVARQMMMNQ